MVHPISTINKFLMNSSYAISALLNLLEAVVQNTEMGKNTLEQILPMTNDVQFKAELLRQRNIYHQLNQEAHTAIEACGGSAQGQSTMAKLNTKTTSWWSVSFASNSSGISGREAVSKTDRKSVV